MEKKMLKQLLFITALFCLFGFTPHTASHGDWVHLYSNDEYELFVNLKERTSDYQGVRMWTKAEYYEEQHIDDINYIKVRELHLIDCKKQSLKMLSTVFYNQAGEVVYSFSQEPYLAKSNSFIPDTIGFKVYKAACDR